jgi:predicted alpha/beta hydrolase family esterase
MTNKSKIVISAVAALLIAVSINGRNSFTRERPETQRKQVPPQNMQPPAILAQVASDQKPREPVEPTSSQEEVLKVIGAGLRSLENKDGADRARLAKAGHIAMESFLQNWKPVGKTTHELKTLFGMAKEETGEHLLYAFDNGNYAWLYQFTIRDGRVIELTRPLSD